MVIPVCPIPPIYYQSIFITGIFLLITFYCAFSPISTASQAIKGNKTFIPALVLIIFLSWMIGMRPYSGFFGDSYLYRHLYYFLNYDNLSEPGNTEIGYFYLMKFCHDLGLDAHGLFLVIAILHFGSDLWACTRLFRNNVWVGVLTVIGTFCFYGYVQNGIRNGLACSILLLGLSFLIGNKKEKIVGIAICLLATSLHKSVTLPFLMCCLSIVWFRKFDWAYKFWMASILISLVAGGAVTGFFNSLGFDDRMASYTSQSLYMHQFSRTGFRWDFLLFSTMPILLGYHIIKKKGIRDRKYELLLNTYILSNAFWVMVIRSSFSNRFAYLSWFMYGVVLIYPLLHVRIWPQTQGIKLKMIMFANAFFAFFMMLIGK